MRRHQDALAGFADLRRAGLILFRRLLQLLAHGRVRRGEIGHAVDHRLRGFHDLFLVPRLVVVRPGDADHAQERHQCLLRGKQHALVVGLAEDVRGQRLGQLQGPVVGDEHDHVVQRLVPLPDVILVTLGSQ